MAITTTPSGGPQGEYSTYTPIYSTTLTSAVVGVTFSNIPQGYTDLVIVATAQSNVTGSDINNFRLQFNGDYTGNYSGTYLSGASSTATSARDSNSTVMYIGAVSMTSATSRAHSVLHIMNYSNNKTFKTVLGKAGLGTSTVTFQSGLWRSTNPITSLYLSLPSQTLNIGTTVTMYGVKAASAQFIPTKAAGGDIIVSDGTYAYHAFLSTGTFTAAGSLTADVLVLAGGGGGQQDVGGGGGAGGLLYKANHSFVSGTNYVCTIGAGGVNGNGNATSGSNTSVNALFVSYGGGKGGYYNTNAPADGGSGGGGGGGNGGATAGGATTQTSQNGATAYGTAGGQGVGSNYYTAGGGGGAGVPGSSGSGYNGGNGGNGLNTWSSWLTPLNLGVNGYIAGGGGGGSGNSGTQTTGGLGGGGNGKIRNGSYSDSYSNAVANTGSGGGGCGGTGVGLAGNGSSGLVIVRYAL